MTTVDELTKIHKKICQEALDLAVQRGDEYATKEDTLKTFRLAGDSMSKPPSSVALTLLSIKFMRICEQISKGMIPKDSIRDLINYGIYLEVLLNDEIV